MPRGVHVASLQPTRRPTLNASTTAAAIEGRGRQSPEALLQPAHAKDLLEKGKASSGCWKRMLGEHSSLNGQKKPLKCRQSDAELTCPPCYYHENERSLNYCGNLHSRKQLVPFHPDEAARPLEGGAGSAQFRKLLGTQRIANDPAHALAQASGLKAQWTKSP